MTQNTKNLLMIGGVAVVGYFLWKQFGAKKNFANASGRLTGRRRIDALPDCPKCSKEGFCLGQQIVPRTEATIAQGIAGQRVMETCSGGTTTSTASRR